MGTGKREKGWGGDLGSSLLRDMLFSSVSDKSCQRTRESLLLFPLPISDGLSTSKQPRDDEILGMAQP